MSLNKASRKAFYNDPARPKDPQSREFNLLVAEYEYAQDAVKYFTLGISKEEFISNRIAERKKHE